MVVLLVVLVDYLDDLLDDLGLLPFVLALLRMDLALVLLQRLEVTLALGCFSLDRVDHESSLLRAILLKVPGASIIEPVSLLDQGQQRFDTLIVRLRLKGQRLAVLEDRAELSWQALAQEAVRVPHFQDLGLRVLRLKKVEAKHPVPR